MNPQGWLAVLLPVVTLVIGGGGVLAWVKWPHERRHADRSDALERDKAVAEVQQLTTAVARQAVLDMQEAMRFQDEQHARAVEQIQRESRWEMAELTRRVSQLEERLEYAVATVKLLWETGTWPNGKPPLAAWLHEKIIGTPKGSNS